MYKRYVYTQYTVYIHTVYKSYTCPPALASSPPIFLFFTFESPGPLSLAVAGETGSLTRKLLSEKGDLWGSLGKMMSNPRGAGWITSYYYTILLPPGWTPYLRSSNWATQHLSWSAGPATIRFWIGCAKSMPRKRTKKSSRRAKFPMAMVLVM